MAVSEISVAGAGTSSPKGRTGTIWTEHPRLVIGLLLLAVWEATVRALAPAYVAKPSLIAVALPKVLADAAFWRSAGESLAAVAQGLAIAIVLGTLIGLCIGRLRIVDAVLRHYISGFYAVPMVVALPLFSLWFGYTSAARLATIVFASVFAIIMNVAEIGRAHV